MTASAGRILYVVNHWKFFYSHRLPLARAARDAGFDVHVAAPDMGYVPPAPEPGIVHHDVPIGRGFGSLIGDFLSVGRLAKLCRTHAITLLHAFTHKPVLLAGLARRRGGSPGAVYSITGLGHLALGSGARVALARRLFFKLLHGALRVPRAEVTFQNEDDLRMFIEAGIALPDHAHLIRGTGVDLSEFPATPEPNGPCVVLAPTRLLREKGVVEFAEAAASVRRERPDIRFVLVGGPDPGNPSSLPAELVEGWVKAGAVEWWGHRDDMPATLARAHLICLPSYREGVPRVLMEAASSGRPIIATDVPGCREAVLDGVNGLRIAPRDAGAIAAAVLSLARDPERRRAMGARSRELAVDRFDHVRLSARMLEVYRKVLHD